MCRKYTDIPMVYLVLWAMLLETSADSCKNIVRLADLNKTIQNQTRLMRDLEQVVQDQRKVIENQTRMNDDLKKTMEYVTRGKLITIFLQKIIPGKCYTFNEYFKCYFTFQLKKY